MKKYKNKQIKIIIKEAELPKNTKFVGYVIHLTKSDEYLAGLKKNDGMTLYKWSKTPEIAIKFKEHRKAKAFIEGYEKNQAILCLMLDIGKQLVVVPEQTVIEIIEEYTEKQIQ